MSEVPTVVAPVLSASTTRPKQSPLGTFRLRREPRGQKPQTQEAWPLKLSPGFIAVSGSRL